MHKLLKMFALAGMMLTGIGAQEAEAQTYKEFQPDIINTYRTQRFRTSTTRPTEGIHEFVNTKTGKQFKIRFKDQNNSGFPDEGEEIVSAESSTTYKDPETGKRIIEVEQVGPDKDGNERYVHIIYGFRKNGEVLKHLDSPKDINGSKAYIASQVFFWPKQP
jgi:hypothetical protein